MIAAFDVKYEEDGSAVVAAIVFPSFESASFASSYRKRVAKVAAYQPGAFYKRELPCILSLLEEVRERVDVVIVDGYVHLGDKPGLGAHLQNVVGDEISVIGVAKSPFVGSPAFEVLRGASKRPLFITAVGMPVEEAAAAIKAMDGRNRMPTLLKAVDALTRATFKGAGT